MVTMQEELEEVAGQRVVLQHLKSPVHQKTDTRTRTHTDTHICPYGQPQDQMSLRPWTGPGARCWLFSSLFSSLFCTNKRRISHLHRSDLEFPNPDRGCSRPLFNWNGISCVTQLAYPRTHTTPARCVCACLPPFLQTHTPSPAFHPHILLFSRAERGQRTGCLVWRGCWGGEKGRMCARVCTHSSAYLSACV